jgi:Transglycosylase SLT domain
MTEGSANDGMGAPRRWLRRVALSALTGGGITVVTLTWPAAGGAIPGIKPPVPSGGAAPPTTTTSSTSTSEASSSSESTSTTTSPPSTTSSPSGVSGSSGQQPSSTSTGTSTGHTHSTTHHSHPAPGTPTVKQQHSQSSPHPTTTVTRGKSNHSSTKGKGPTGSHTPANVPSNIAAPPQVVASHSGVLAALTSGLTVSSQALDLFYQVPPFLLPIYQAAAVQYGVPWEVLAAINEVETDYGNDQSVSTAGAVGWMQFMPATWLQYGVDALDAGYADPYNPVDAIFAAGRYLAAAGASHNLRSAVFSYNHSEAYVESVLLRARLLASYPPSVIATLTGIVEGSPPLSGAHVVQSSVDATAFPVAASTPTGGATPAPSPTQAARVAQVPNAQTAKNHASAQKSSKPKSVLPTPQQFVALEGPANVPVVAVQNGRIVALGHSHKLGNYIALEDVYGDVFTYANLGSIATRYRLPSDTPSNNAPSAAFAASKTAAGPTPSEAASAGSQPQTLQAKAAANAQPPASSAASVEEESTGNVPPGSGKVLMFAHPGNPDARAAAARFAPRGPSYPKGWGPLRVGAVVSQGVTLGSSTPGTASSTPSSGSPAGTASPTASAASSHTGSLHFAIRPAGDSSAVDPRPILQNWDQLQHALHPQGAKGSSGLVGATASDVFLLSRTELEHAVLADPDIELPTCARHEVIAGRVDSRVLALLLFLSRNGLKPTVSDVRCTPGSSANAHSALAQGEGVDISKISGVPIAGHQGAGTITDLTIRTLLTLQGRFAAHSIVSLMRYPGAPTTQAQVSHTSFIGVDFTPAHASVSPQAAAAAAAHSAGPGATAPSPFAVSLGLAAGGSSALSAGQWNQLLTRIGSLPQPKVATKPSSSAIRDPQSASPSQGSGAHH